MVFALWDAGQRETNDDDSKLSALGATCDVSKHTAEILQPHLESYELAERLMLFDAAINLPRGSCQEGWLEKFCDKAKDIPGLTGRRQSVSLVLVKNGRATGQPP